MKKFQQFGLLMKVNFTLHQKFDCWLFIRMKSILRCVCQKFIQWIQRSIIWVLMSFQFMICLHSLFLSISLMSMSHLSFICFISSFVNQMVFQWQSRSFLWCSWSTLYLVWLIFLRRFRINLSKFCCVYINLYYFILESLLRFIRVISRFIQKFFNS